MNLNRDCPFCGTEEVEIKVEGRSSPEGIPVKIICSGCGASTKVVYCRVGDYSKALIEWKTGDIYSTYISRC